MMDEELNIVLTLREQASKLGTAMTALRKIKCSTSLRDTRKEAEKALEEISNYGPKQKNSESL
ncbi:MAG: hypothetical protein ACTSU6_02575 [Candidatus Njordarchaeales archaeon]